MIRFSIKVGMMPKSFWSVLYIFSIEFYKKIIVLILQIGELIDQYVLTFPYPQWFLYNFLLKWRTTP